MNSWVKQWKCFEIDVEFFLFFFILSIIQRAQFHSFFVLASGTDTMFNFGGISNGTKRHRSPEAVADTEMTKDKVHCVSRPPNIPSIPTEHQHQRRNTEAISAPGLRTFTSFKTFISETARPVDNLSPQPKPPGTIYSTTDSNSTQLPLPRNPFSIVNPTSYSAFSTLMRVPQKSTNPQVFDVERDEVVSTTYPGGCTPITEVQESFP